MDGNERVWIINPPKTQKPELEYVTEDIFLSEEEAYWVDRWAEEREEIQAAIERSRGWG